MEERTSIIFIGVLCTGEPRGEITETVAVYWFTRERLSAPSCSSCLPTLSTSAEWERPFERQSDYRNKIDPSEFRASAK